jgi:hypothetical protein
LRSLKIFHGCNFVIIFMTSNNFAFIS